MKNTPTRSDIIIIGAGTPGLALSLLLAKKGLTVSLIDPVPLTAEPRDTDTRTSALMAGSLAVLNEAGLNNKSLDEIGTDLKALRIINDAPAIARPADVLFRAEEIDQAIFGKNLPNGALRKVLAGLALKEKNILFYPQKLKSCEIDDFGANVTLDNGEELRAPLLVGADGRNSPTRQQAKIDIKTTDYGQTAMTCYIGHTITHDNTSTEFHRPGGPFTIVPLGDNRSSIVWVEKTPAAEKLIQLSREHFTAALQERTKDLLGTVTLEREPQSWPLIFQRAVHLTAPRLALVGEAAHVVHPIGAQGLNMSLRDVANLAAVIEESLHTGSDYGSRTALEQYEKERHSDLRSRSRGIHSLNNLVSRSSGWAAIARNLGLKTLETVPSLKEAVMHYGLAPDVPGIKKTGNNRH